MLFKALNNWIYWLFQILGMKCFWKRSNIIVEFTLITLIIQFSYIGWNHEIKKPKSTWNFLWNSIKAKYIVEGLQKNFNKNHMSQNTININVCIKRKLLQQIYYLSSKSAKSYIQVILDSISTKWNARATDHIYISFLYSDDRWLIVYNPCQINEWCSIYIA